MNLFTTQERVTDVGNKLTVTKKNKKQKPLQWFPTVLRIKLKLFTESK